MARTIARTDERPEQRNEFSSVDYAKSDKYSCVDMAETLTVLRDVVHPHRVGRLYLTVLKNAGGRVGGRLGGHHSIAGRSSMTAAHVVCGLQQSRGMVEDKTDLTDEAPRRDSAGFDDDIVPRYLGRKHQPAQAPSPHRDQTLGHCNIDMSKNKNEDMLYYYEIFDCSCRCSDASRLP